MPDIPDPNLMLQESDGTEAVRVLKNGRWRWIRTALLKGFQGPAGAAIATGQGAPTQEGRPGDFYLDAVTGDLYKMET